MLASAYMAITRAVVLCEDAEALLNELEVTRTTTRVYIWQYHSWKKEKKGEVATTR